MSVTVSHRTTKAESTQKTALKNITAVITKKRQNKPQQAREEKERERDNALKYREFYKILLFSINSFPPH